MQTDEILNIIASIAIIVSAAATTFAAIFVSLQVAHMKRGREVDTFLRLVAAGNDDNMRKAADWVKYEMDALLTYEKAKKEKMPWDHISTVVHYFEMCGVLIGNGHISSHLLYDQMGPWIAGTWGKLEPIIAAHRTAKHAPDYAENFELLARGFYEWAAKVPPKLEKRTRAGDVRNYYKLSPKTLDQDN